MRSLNGATAERLRSPVLRQSGFSTGQLPINASLRSHVLYLGRFMSGIEQKAMSRAVLSLFHQGHSQPQDRQPTCVVSLLNMVDVSKNMKKTTRNYISRLPAPVRNKQDWTASHRPLLFPMPLLVRSGASIHAAAHLACLRFSHV